MTIKRICHFLSVVLFCALPTVWGQGTISQSMNNAIDYEEAKLLYDTRIQHAKEELNKAIEAEKKYPQRDEPKERIKGWTENIFLWDKAYSMRLVDISAKDIKSENSKHVFEEYNKGLTAISSLLSILKVRKTNNPLYESRYDELIYNLEGAKNGLNEMYLSKLRLIHERPIHEDISSPLKEYAEQGNPEVQYILATCYQEGNGVKQSIKEAIKWWRKSAEQGNIQSLYKLGNCYFVGDGVGKDKEEAVKYYKQAAEHGLAEAQYSLAACLLYGEGIKKDRNEAILWLKKAADQDHRNAQRALAIQSDVDNGENNTADKNNTIPIGRGTSSVVLDLNPMVGSSVFNNFVGFDDNIDFARIELASSAYLCFELEATDATDFTIWKKDVGGKMSKVDGVTSLTAKNEYNATTKMHFFEKSDKYEYYISMECPDANEGVGKYVYYNIEIGKDTLFFDSADSGKNDVLYDKKAKEFFLEDEKHHFVTTDIFIGTNTIKLDANAIGNRDYENFVGYDDATDYARIRIKDAGYLSFTIVATGDATFVVYKKGLDKKGKETLDTIQTIKLELAKDNKIIEKTSDTLVNIEPGDYFISMTASSIKANNKGSVFYNVKATLSPPTPKR